MTPGKYDLDLYRGDSYAWTFRLWQDDARTQPADLEGATAAAQLRDKPGGSEVIDLACSVVSSGPPGNPVWNTVQVELPAGSWADAPGLGCGVWDLQVTYPGAVVQTVVAGKVTVRQDVTRTSADARRAVRVA